MEIALPIILAFAATALSALLLASVADKTQPPKETAGSERGSCAIYLGVALICNAAGALFMRLFYGNGWQEILRVLLAQAVLWACAWVDIKSRIIPNKILLLGVLLRCVHIALGSLLTPAETRYTLMSSAVAAVALFVASMLCRLVSSDSIGFGDVKLLAFMGFCMQNDRVWGAIFLTAVVAFLYSLFLLVFRKATRKTEMPFAPLLLVGTVAASIITTV